MKTKKQIREYFRLSVIERDKYTCKVCGSKSNDINYFDAHHITDRSEMPNGGYVKENGITLCKLCHVKCEKYHISNGKEYESGLHPDDLYLMINSSKEIAIKESKKLNKQ